MSASPKKPNIQARKKSRFGLPDDPDTVPQDSLSTMGFQTLMDMKETLGEVKAAIGTLTTVVNDVRQKQEKLEKDLSTYKAIFWTISTILGLVGTVAGIYAAFVK